MDVRTFPERYMPILEAAIRDALGRIERDRQEPGWVPAFAIDEGKTGIGIVMLGAVSATKLMTMTPAA